MMIKKIFSSSYSKDIIRFLFLFACTATILYDPIDRLLNNDVLYFSGYKPLLFSARDNLWAVAGLVGATVLLLMKDRFCGFLLQNFSALGFILSALIEEIFSIQYYQNFYIFGTMMILSIFILISNTVDSVKWNRKRKVTALLLPAISVIGICLLSVRII